MAAPNYAKTVLAGMLTAAMALALTGAASALSSTTVKTYNDSIAAPSVEQDTFSYVSPANFFRLQATSWSATPNLDICWYANGGGVPIRCFATSGDEMGWIPNGAGYAVVSLSGGINVHYTLKLQRLS